jgi:Tfp pilus assembly protein PilO
MRGIPVDRLWLIGGAVGAVLLVVVAWFLVIGPQNAETNSLNDQAATAEVRLVSLKQRLAELQKQSADLPRYEAERAKDRQALPTTSAMSDFLRELQSIGDITGVVVSGLTVGNPASAPGVKGQIQALPVTVTATGPGGKVNEFLDQLQQVQPRAVLITSANVTATDPSGGFGGLVGVMLSLQVFVAPATASASAQPSVGPS